MFKLDLVKEQKLHNITDLFFPFISGSYVVQLILCLLRFFIFYINIDY